MSPIVSIIVPVYNVEPYLHRCIDSILGQTFSDFELILIDDGSSDNSGKICDEYANKDLRIKVIHKENGGQSSARNAGLDIAQGEYIGFVDSDDYIAADMYAVLLSEVSNSNSDIVVCSTIRVIKGKEIVSDKKIQRLEMNNREGLKQLLVGALFKEGVWSKLYKRFLFDDIRFAEGLIFEDLLIAIDLFARANKVTFVDVPCYYYVYRQGSTIHSKITGRKMDIFGVIESREQFFRNNYPDLLSDLFFWYFSYAFDFLNILLKSEDDESKNIIKQICANVQKQKSKIINNSRLTIKQKILLCIIIINIKFYKKIIFKRQKKQL